MRRDVLIRHSAEIIVHRIARLSAVSLEAGQAMVAKVRGELMVKAAVKRLDAPEGSGPGVDRRFEAGGQESFHALDSA